MPFEDVKKEALEGAFAKLSRMSPMAADYWPTRNQHWSGWRKCHAVEQGASGSTIDITKAKEISGRGIHYELKKVKDRILDYLSVLELKPEHEGAGSCKLCWPSGRGQQDEPGAVDCEGAGTEVPEDIAGRAWSTRREIRGHRRGRILARCLGRDYSEAFADPDCNDPVIMLDEMDKLGRDFKRRSGVGAA